MEASHVMVGIKVPEARLVGRPPRGHHGRRARRVAAFHLQPRDADDAPMPRQGQVDAPLVDGFGVGRPPDGAAPPDGAGQEGRRGRGRGRAGAGRGRGRVDMDRVDDGSSMWASLKLTMSSWPCQDVGTKMSTTEHRGAEMFVRDICPQHEHSKKYLPADGAVGLQIRSPFRSAVAKKMDFTSIANSIPSYIHFTIRTGCLYGCRLRYSHMGGIDHFILSL